MKSKKGFTLVEILAAVVIISILAMIAIPNVTKSIEQSRKKSFVEDARTIISATRSNYLAGSYEESDNVTIANHQVTYSKESVQETLSKKLGKGPFNSNYKDAGVIIKEIKGSRGETRNEYYVCLIDEAGNGFDYTLLENLDADSISQNKGLTKCGDVADPKYTINVSVINGTTDSSSKTVTNYQTATFNLTPNNANLDVDVECTNDQIGNIKNNVLTLKNVTSNTTCEVNYSGSETVVYNDHTMIINERTSDREANSRKHGGVKKTYAPLSDSNPYVFTEPGQSPWNQDPSVTRIEIGRRIKPTSTAWWFWYLESLEEGDFSKLDTSNVTDMNHMFYGAGYNDTQGVYSDKLVLTGFDKWDTSKVKNMSWMFARAGRDARGAWSLDNLSNWDTSNVTDMNHMFYEAGITSTSWQIGDLSNWDVSKVTNMTNMFYANGSSNAKSFDIGNLSNWNVSNVENMSYMFYAAARQKGETFNVGDLSKWDTRKVEDMTSMFWGVCQNCSNWHNIGTLKVYASKISAMFYQSSSARATLSIYSNPSAEDNGINYAFTHAATADGAQIKVNYSRNTTNIDEIIATKSSDSNIVKGSLLD